MADVDVKNQSSDQPSKENTQEHPKSLLRRTGAGDEFFSGNPFTLMRRMSEEMDRTFGQFFGQTSGGSGSWYPAIEVTEREGQLHVHAELPGVKPEDVKVEITDDVLTIRGERKSEHEHRIGKAYRSERRYGEFYREVPLPDGVNAEQANAQFRDGVLEISVPVPQQARNRREIPIQSGQAAATPSKGPTSADSPTQTTSAKAAS